MSTRHRQSASGSASGLRYIGVAAAIVIAVSVSIWVVVSPSSGGKDRAGADPSPPPTVTHSKATDKTVDDPAPASKPRPAPAPVERWKYRNQCPDTATACVDLKDKVTWLQKGGVVFYGPVPMEPGSTGAETPPGTFEVAYKDQHHISNEFNEPMPNSVFFAPGGIAFHEGSLTKGSHGCVHLTWRDSAYFFQNLPVGAQVVVF